MLIYSHKVLDTVVEAGTVEESDPDLWAELARASDLFLQVRYTAVVGSAEYRVVCQSSNDGKRWSQVSELKDIPSAGVTTTLFDSRFNAGRGCNMRFTVSLLGVGSARVEAWVTGRAKQQSRALRQIRTNTAIGIGARIPALGRSPSSKSMTSLARAPSMHALTRGPGFVVGTGQKAGRKHGCGGKCGCAPCGKSKRTLPDFRSAIPIGGETCVSLADRAVLSDEPGLTGPGWIVIPFTPAQQAILQMAWEAAEEAFPLPREGIDPSTGSPWTHETVDTLGGVRLLRQRREEALDLVLEPRGYVEGADALSPWGEVILSILESSPEMIELAQTMGRSAGMLDVPDDTGAIHRGDVYALARWIAQVTVVRSLCIGDIMGNTTAIGPEDGPVQFEYSRSLGDYRSIPISFHYMPRAYRSLLPSFLRVPADPMPPLVVDWEHIECPPGQCPHYHVVSADEMLRLQDALTQAIGDTARFRTDDVIDRDVHNFAFRQAFRQALCGDVPPNACPDFRESDINEALYRSLYYHERSGYPLYGRPGAFDMGLPPFTRCGGC